MNKLVKQLNYDRMELAERLENAKRIAIEVEFCGLCGRQGGFSFGEEFNEASGPAVDLILMLWEANAMRQRNKAAA